MKLINTTCPILSYEVPNHAELKQSVIDSIKSMGTFSYKTGGQSIHNTDWHLHPEFPRPYFKLLEPLANTVIQNAMVTFDAREMKILNFWFQEYHKGDFHEWHTHNNALFSNVYYLSLPEGSSQTHFRVNGEEFSVPVTEGCVLTFPAFYSHTSKEHKGEDPKMVFVFNI